MSLSTLVASTVESHFIHWGYHRLFGVMSNDGILMMAVRFQFPYYSKSALEENRTCTSGFKRT